MFGYCSLLHTLTDLNVSVIDKMNVHYLSDLGYH